VTDCDDGFPVQNVTVTATNTATSDVFTGETDATGNYQFNVDEGTYDINFFKLSYLPTDVSGIFGRPLQPGPYVPQGNGIKRDT